ncbi:MAG: tape measure protein [Bacteroidetes bacterium]|nr:tape measure protein [Bacteroidota bacterium]
MAQEDGRIYHGIALDLSQLKKDEVSVKNIYKNLTKSIQEEGSKIDSIFNKIRNASIAYLSASTAKDFLNQLVNVRAEVESLQVAYRVLIGDQVKADKLFGQMRDYSIKTPLTLMDLTKSGQTLMQFGIDSEKVMHIIKMLGDVSLGNADKLQRLSLAYGQMSALGRANGRDILQLIDAGFNPLQYIAEKTGKTIEFLNKEMEQGRIPMSEITKAFEYATGEGGKFNGMLLKQSETINGLKSNLTDIINNQLNEFGKANEDIIKGVLTGSIDAVKNYKEITEAVIELIAIYGTYKAALILITTLHEAYAVQAALATATTGTYTTAQIAAATATTTLQRAVMSLNNTLIVNPYAIVAGGIAMVAYATYSLVTHVSEAEKTYNRLNEAKADSIAETIKEQAQIDILFIKLKQAKKGTDEYNSAKNQIINQYGQYLKGLGDEKTALNDVALAYKIISENAIEAAKSRSLAKAIDAESDLMFEKLKSNTKRFQDELINTFGKDRGNVAFEILRPVIEGKQAPNATQQKILKAFNYTDKSSLSLGPGMGSSVTSINESYNKMTSIIADNIQAKKDFDEAVKTLNTFFGGIKPYAETPGNTGGGNGGGGKPGKDNSKELAKLEQQKNERERSIKELTESLKQMEFEANQDLVKARIDNMADGFNKEMAQIDLNFKTKLSDNEEKMKQWLEVLRDQKELEWQATHPEEMKAGKIFDRSTIQFKDLSKSLQTQYKETQKEILNWKYLEERKFEEKLQNESIEKEKEKIDKLLEYQRDKNKIESDKNQSENDKKNTFWDTSKKIKSTRLELEYYQRELDLLNQKFKNDNLPETANEIDHVKNKIKELNNEIQKLDSQLLAEKFEGLEKIAGQLGNLDGEIGKLFSGLSGQFGTLKGLLDGTATEMDAISSAVGIVVDIVNSITEATKNRKESEKQFYTDALDYAHQYALALNEQLRLQAEISGNGFVKNYAGEISGAFNALTDATNKYNEAIALLSTGKAVSGQKNAIDWNVVTKGVMGAGLVGGIATLIGGKKKENVFEDLLKLHPDIIDQYGNINRSIAQALLNANQVNEETKQLIQNTLDWEDAINTAKDSISGIVHDLAGDLGNSLENNLIDAFKSGEDASKSMFEAAGQSLEQFLQKVIFSAVFGDIFKKLEEEIKTSLTTGDQNVIDDYQRFADEYNQRISRAEKALTDAQNAAKNSGFNLWQPDTTAGNTSTAKKGIAQASQDSVDELNGRFTAVQGHTFSIAESMKTANEISRSQLTALNRIDVNTARLEAVERSLGSIKAGIDDITTKGIKLK